MARASADVNSSGAEMDFYAAVVYQNAASGVERHGGIGRCEQRHTVATDRDQHRQDAEAENDAREHRLYHSE